MKEIFLFIGIFLVVAIFILGLFAIFGEKKEEYTGKDQSLDSHPRPGKMDEY